MKQLKDHNFHGIDATIIADSVNFRGDRITSFVLTFPRPVLAEFNTHRVFSRNSASSRAIPVWKMLENALDYPFMPMAYQEDHKGMQGKHYFEEEGHIDICNSEWLNARDAAINGVSKLASIYSFINEDNENVDVDVTKQLRNRLLEPFMWHTVIVTATHYGNFYELRCPQYTAQNIIENDSDEPAWKQTFKSRKDFVKSLLVSSINGTPVEEMTDLDWLKINNGDAEIHISKLAELMWDEQGESIPKELEGGEWHIPFGDTFDTERLNKLFSELYPDELTNTPYYNRAITDLKVQIATARCARVSYLNYEGTDDYNKDIELYNRLAEMQHMSPFEHCAYAMNQYEYENFSRSTPMAVEAGWCNNFRGFIQGRWILENVK